MNVKTLTKFIKKNSVGICSGASIICTVAAVATSIPATAKAVRIIDKAEKENGTPLTFKEKFKLSWKLYIPTVLSTAGSIAASAVGGVSASKQISSLATTISSLTAAHEVYKEDIKKALGQEKYEEVRQKVAEEKTTKIADDEEKPCDLYCHDGNIPCQDLQTGKRFWTTYEKAINAKEKIIEQVSNGWGQTIADLYYEMDVPNKEIGEMLHHKGWEPDAKPLIMITLGYYKSGEPFLTIDYDYSEREPY